MSESILHLLLRYFPNAEYAMFRADASPAAEDHRQVYRLASPLDVSVRGEMAKRLSEDFTRAQIGFRVAAYEQPAPGGLAFFRMDHAAFGQAQLQQALEKVVAFRDMLIQRREHVFAAAFAGLAGELNRHFPEADVVIADSAFLYAMARPASAYASGVSLHIHGDHHGAALYAHALQTAMGVAYPGGRAEVFLTEDGRANLRFTAAEGLSSTLLQQVLPSLTELFRLEVLNYAMRKEAVSRLAEEAAARALGRGDLILEIALDLTEAVDGRPVRATIDFAYLRLDANAENRLASAFYGFQPEGWAVPQFDDAGKLTLHAPEGISYNQIRQALDSRGRGRE